MAKRGPDPRAVRERQRSPCHVPRWRAGRSSRRAAGVPEPLHEFLGPGFRRLSGEGGGVVSEAPSGRTTVANEWPMLAVRWKMTSMSAQQDRGLAELSRQVAAAIPRAENQPDHGGLCAHLLVGRPRHDSYRERRDVGRPPRSCTRCLDCRVAPWSARRWLRPHPVRRDRQFGSRIQGWRTPTHPGPLPADRSSRSALRSMECRRPGRYAPCLHARRPTRNLEIAAELAVAASCRVPAACPIEQ